MTTEHIGSYPIEREIGRGGMGVVYLGRDTRLDRPVAIKVLPEVFASDPERLARFEREARLVASLNHPNIAGIYGLEEDGGRRFLALEYVGGETLAERIARGALPLDETLDLCRQVAAAVEAAHEGGVVHRDLKPANIKITPAGDIKVLDFGLAKGGAAATSESALDLSHSPTMALTQTGTGVILGTAAYMSPEQARGKAVDKRTDIWAFGCLLFECLTGRQAFAGETVSDMIARILQGEPEWNALPERTPERIRGLLRRCLEKDVRRRLRDIGDARMEIEDVQAVRASSSSVAAGAAVQGSRRRLEWVRLAAVAAIAAAVTWFVPRAIEKPVNVDPTRFTIAQPDGFFMNTDGSSPTLSPDGRTLAFVAFDSTGGSRIWLRPLHSTDARPIPGTEKTGGMILWSPDGRQIAFVSEGKLRKIGVAGGDAEVLCPVKEHRGGTWGKDGVILIASTSNGPIERVSENGGEPEPVTVLDEARGETAHRFPQFLPDGRHFLFSVLPAREGKFETWVGSLDSPERRLLLSAATGVTLAPGHLLYARGGKLIAQGFDAKAIQLKGEPVPLGDAVNGTDSSGGPIASASSTGALAYGTYRPMSRRLAWVDLSGNEIAPIPLPPGPYSFGSLSPDDRRMALVREESSDAADIWIADLERGVATRFTDESGYNNAPDWSPDGTRIAYTWSDNSPQIIKVKSLAGNTVETFVDDDPLFKRLDGWTPDGRSIVYGRLDPETKWDLWVLPMDGDRTPRAFLETRFNELGGSVSPDGRWISYLSDESGQTEAYVQSYPVPGNKYQVTSGGADWVGWTPDGTHLIFGLRSDRAHGRMAEILAGSEFRLGPPRVFVTFPKDSRGLRPARSRSAGQAMLPRLIALFQAGPEPINSVTVVLDGLPEGAGR